MKPHLAPLTQERGFLFCSGDGRSPQVQCQEGDRPPDTALSPKGTRYALAQLLP
ncbi:hypothetical protein [Scytonema sp. HK-05]|uniref:hypothetical protein n=1 Tax=Scytonema sp. HK-05 TaxID=1137095 RepID=UPI0013016C6D|nr:hypothetical protein [Scytonema sp. HK-05]